MANKPYVQPGEPLNDFLRAFWQRQIATAEQETPDYRHPPLPLARIKKVMKSDPDVKELIYCLRCTYHKFYASAPILFCKACEIFISEITARAFIIADSNKRRTLSRSDIAKALTKSDQFDFLIDIVPRDELPFPGGALGANGAKKGVGSASVKRDQNLTSRTHAEIAAVENGDRAPGDTSEVLDQLESLLNPPATQDRPQLS